MKIIKSIDKGVAILNCFYDHESLSLVEITNLTSFSKSSTFDILNTLVVNNLLVQDPISKKYSLGIKNLELGSLYRTRNPLTKIALPYCEQLQRNYQTTVHLTIPDRGNVVYIGKFEDYNHSVSLSYIGNRLPMSCTGVGKAMLAFLGEEYLQKYILINPLPTPTPKSIQNEEALRADLSKIRENGYAIDDEEMVEGLKCIAAPIFNSNHDVVGAISVSKLTPAMTDEILPNIIKDVVAAAEAISKR